MTEEKGLWWFINLLTGVVLAGLAWWNNDMRAEHKKLRDRVDAQQGQINALQVLVAGTYITRDEFRQDIKELTQTMTEGFDKMDSKMGDIYDELKHKVDKP